VEVVAPASGDTANFNPPLGGYPRNEARNLLSVARMAARLDIQLPELALVMPIYNEAVNVRSVVGEWFECLDNCGINFVFFAVNDGSSDSTAVCLDELAQQLGPRLRVINKPNSGHGRSCRHGYELALSEGTPWMFQIDSDGQCDPTFFPQFYGARNDSDCVFGYRRSRDDGWGRVAISFCCRMLLWIRTGKNLEDPNVPYRLMRATALRNALRKIPADFDLQNIALTFALKCEPDLRWQHLPIHFRARRGGENSINYRKIVKLGANLLRDFNRITTRDADVPQRPTWLRRRVVS